MLTQINVARFASSILLLVLTSAVDGQIQFDKPKAEPLLPNPMIVGAARDDVRSTVKQILETREIPLDKEDCGAQNGECILITKPVVFIKGITTKSQLEHYTEVLAPAIRDWIKGRYSLRIHVSPATPKSAQLGVYARFEGMPEGVLGTDWVPLNSKGILEDKLLRCIDLRIRGIECKEDAK